MGIRDGKKDMLPSAGRWDYWEISTHLVGIGVAEDALDLAKAMASGRQSL